MNPRVYEKWALLTMALLTVGEIQTNTGRLALAGGFVLDGLRVGGIINRMGQATPEEGGQSFELSAQQFVNWVYHGGPRLPWITVALESGNPNSLDVLNLR